MVCEWVSKRVGIIDTFGYGSGGAVASYVIRGDDVVAVVDVGYSPSWERVLNGIRELGVELEDVGYVFLTHFHLDHAGASHKVLQHLPNASIILHEGAIRHLIDPSRLVDAALAAFGEDMAGYIGDLEPIQPERMEPARETRYELVGVEVFFTPGHVPSHLSIYVEDEGAVITGDAVNVRHPSLPFPVPPASPPFYDVEKALESLEKIRSLNPKRLYTPHYGVRNVIPGLFEEEETAITWWLEEIERMMNEGMNADQIVENLRKTLLARAGTNINELDSYARNILLGRLAKISVLGYMGYIMRRR